MAHEIVQYTYVRMNGNQYICKTFPEIWDLLQENNCALNEEEKGNLLRFLFINGKCKAGINGTTVEFEIR